MRTFNVRHLVLVFAVGLAAGLAIGLHYSRWHLKRPGLGSGPRFVEKFSRDLKLTAEQEFKLQAILDKKRGELKSVRETVDPKLRKIRRDTTAEIEKILTSEQVELFRKQQKRFGRREGRPGRGLEP